MHTYTDFYEFREAVRQAYSNNWEDIFSYCGISPSKQVNGSYVYYDASPLCHKEKTPSVQEYPNTLYCHACGENHDIFKVCEMVTGREFGTIVRELGERKGLQFEEKKDDNNKNRNTKEGQLNYTSKIVQMVYTAFMTIANHLLLNASSGQPYREYLTSRHLNLDFLKDFSFQLSNNNRIPGAGCIPFGENSSKEIKKHMLSLIQSHVKDSGITSMEKLDEILKVAKLINANGNFKLLGRVIFPVVLQGRIVNIYGRKINDDNDYPKHFYLELENHGFYNYDEARKQELAVYAECIIDAISLLQYGINAISTFGVGGWKSDICLRMLNRSKIKQMYFAYDKDLIALTESFKEYHHHSNMLKYLGPAGTKNAIKTAKEIVNNTNISVRIIDIPYDKGDNGSEKKNDINNMICKLKMTNAIDFQNYFQNLILQARDFDSTELLLKLEIMTRNSRFYTEHDKMEVILDKLNTMHIINAHKVIAIVSEQYNIPFQLLLTYQLGLYSKQNK